MTPSELAALPVLPSSLSLEAQALWHAKQGNWEESHDIAQDIHTAMGSWIHALLHVIEGDQWNADYWFSKARKPSHGPKDIDILWEEIAGQVLKVA
ncbi:MAG TPA: hypothetical protein VGE29_15420 [Prosthecobacter sp.]